MTSKLLAVAVIIIAILCGLYLFTMWPTGNDTDARIAEAEARTVSGFAKIEEAQRAQVEAQEKTERVRIEGQHEINELWAKAGSTEMTENGKLVRRLAVADLVASEQWRTFAMLTLFGCVVGPVTAVAYAVARAGSQEHKCDQCTYEGCDRSATYKAAHRTMSIVARRYPTTDTRPLGRR